jgi:hypothetical protein
LLKTAFFTFLIATLTHLLFCVNTSFVNQVLGIKFEEKKNE